MDLDFLSSSDFWSKAISLISAVVVLATTVLTYRKSRNEASMGTAAAAEGTQTIVGGTGSLKVSFNAGAQRGVEWKVLRIGSILSGAVGLMFCLAAIKFWNDRADSTYVLIVFFNGAFMLGNSVFAFVKQRGGPESAKSLVRREMTVVVEGDFDQLFAKCRRALEKIKTELDVVDMSRRVLEGRTKFNVRWAGERVSIQITDQSPRHFIVLIKSDSVLPTTLFDFGKNAANIRMIVNELMN